MDGGQAQRVGKNELAERAFELGLGRQPDQAQPFSQLHEEMSRALDGVAPPDVDKVLDHHGFVAGGGPHERRPETRKLGDTFQYARTLHGADHRIRQGREGMIRGSQQDAAQPDTVARVSETK